VAASAREPFAELAQERNAWAGVKLTRAERAPRELQTALRRALPKRRGYCDWTVDHADWVLILMSPEDQQFSGKTPEEALAWCLVWLMAPELGIGPFVV
jgi:hypothetical protein